MSLCMHVVCMYVNMHKVKPVLEDLPAKFHIIWDIKGDPLADLPVLTPHPPHLLPLANTHKKEKNSSTKITHIFSFLMSACCSTTLWCCTIKLLHGIIMSEDIFRDFFPPIDIPVIPHKPWVERNICISPGLYNELCKLVKQKIDAGVLKPSNSSYHSRWFCVLKKDRKSLWIVQSLELLNKVTIAHSGIPPFMEQLAKQFAGHTCNSMMDLCVGYNQHTLVPSLRPYYFPNTIWCYVTHYLAYGMD